MNGGIIINQRHFDLDGNADFKINGFTLQLNDSEEELYNRIDNNDIWPRLGTIFRNSLVNRPYFFRQILYIDQNDYQQKTSKIFNEFIEISNFFWFIKDCSFYIDQMAAYWPEGRLTMILNSNVKFCKADTTVDKCTFTSSDVKQVVSLINDYHKINTPIKSLVHKVDFMNDNASVSFRGISEYSELNRIQRAYKFLKSARESLILPAKISFYVLMLECLFSANDTHKIAHKISQRISYYMGSNPEERNRIAKRVKKYYSIRSKYVHGQELNISDKKNEDLAITSLELDELIRNIFIKIIRHDSSIFLQKEKELKLWFDGLVGSAF
ncbi:HEPN domain-containing protein [Spirosoma oryzicola]|uniref:HEPN domain-containing protein n=1 Tax=Spirosoma oryzicola TaxID=2898794 RepID=UPI001E2B6114|nr:HEPN domain-containing protein [Spirosoma oryzicola]UHG92528.1 hypothetical protein LQ777_06375 [Spirosoma oryzicola]